MQTKPDGEYKWIGHIVDHFSRYHVIYPQVNKSAKETAKNIIERFFAYFGLPKIIHSDNGREFVNDIIRAVVLLWPGHAIFVNGNPGHSQSQGMVEQGNNTIQTMISAREKDESSCCWSKWLPEIQC